MTAAAAIRARRQERAPRKGIGSAVVLAVVLAAAVLQAPQARAGERDLTGKVVRVADGDTLTVASRGRHRTVIRLYGIDAPEVRHRETPGQQFGRDARQALKALTQGRVVTVAIVDVDTHGRSVGVVHEGGADINLAMVRGGWAWAYRRHLAAPYASEYIGAEREAREARRGLWVQPNPMPPWEFRRRTR